MDATFLPSAEDHALPSESFTRSAESDGRRSAVERTVLLGWVRPLRRLAALTAVISPQPNPKLEPRRITPEGFALLLTALGDHMRDGSQYERLRSKLIFFFSRRLLTTPEDLADEVMDRLIQHLSRGTQIQSTDAFALGIARHVAVEQRSRKSKTQGVDPVFFDNIPAPSVTINDEEELTRMELCLKKLPRPESKLLRGYYLVTGGNLMTTRRKLAETLHVSPTTLRQRVFLARQRLRNCMTATAQRSKR